MVYAYDKSLPMPVADLYDTQIMAMAVNAAKDMYEKGLQLIKDFQKDYGDFISPFAKDMARYGEMVGGVRDIINNLYANGIDPLRSAEGRAAVAQAIRSIDPAEMNAMRANAKLGYAYQDALGKLNAAGKYDPQMNEYFLQEQGLPSFNDFSTAENGTWGLSSPVEATSLRDLTSAGFAHRTAHDLTPEEAKATLGKAYDPRAKYTGWTYNDLFDTAGTLVPGLQGDWRGRYFRELSKQKALANNPNATEDDINRQFQSDVAESNLLWIIEPKGSLSDYYQQESNNLQRARFNWEKQKYNDQHKDGPTSQWSFEKLVTRSGLTAIVGKLVQEYTSGMLKDVINEQLDFGEKVSKKHGGKSTTPAAMLEFKNKYGQNTYRVSDIAAYMESMGYQKVPNTDATFIIPKNKIDKFARLETLISNTTGFRNKYIKTLRRALNDADVITYTPSGESYQAFMKTDRNESHFGGQVTTYKYKRDENGSIVKNEKGANQYDENHKDMNLYFDPDLKSVKNAPGTGSLNGPRNRDAVDTQDTRFQNAIISDKEVTDKIIKGTVYGSDATLSELPGYAYNE